MVYFVVIWVYFTGFGMLYQEKSGNPVGENKSSSDRSGAIAVRPRTLNRTTLKINVICSMISSSSLFALKIFIWC
jgi:hypothetical protein